MNFYLDNQGAGIASTRFSRRANDLSGAATDLQRTDCSGAQVAQMIEAVVAAGTGRLYAFSDELSMLAQLVDETIVVFNELDVEFTLR